MIGNRRAPKSLRRPTMACRIIPPPSGRICTVCRAGEPLANVGHGERIARCRNNFDRMRTPRTLSPVKNSHACFYQHRWISRLRSVRVQSSCGIHAGEDWSIRREISCRQGFIKELDGHRHVDGRMPKTGGRPSFLQGATLCKQANFFDATNLPMGT